MATKLMTGLATFGLGAALIAGVGCKRDERALGTERAPGEPAPAEKAPAEKAPAEKAPAERAPVERAPGERPPGERAPSAAPGAAAAASNAVNNVSQSRCQREARCNNVGQGKKYASVEACVSDISNKTRDDLNIGDCPGGIDQNELNKCLQEINNQACDNPLDTVSRLAACRSSAICKH